MMSGLHSSFAVLLLGLVLVFSSSTTSADAQSTIKGDPACDFCLQWASSVITQLPANASSSVVKKTLKKSCDPFSDSSQCKAYVNHILGKNVINKMELKNTKVEQQVS